MRIAPLGIWGVLLFSFSGCTPSDEGADEPPLSSTSLVDFDLTYVTDVIDQYRLIWNPHPDPTKSRPPITELLTKSSVPNQGYLLVLWRTAARSNARYFNRGLRTLYGPRTPEGVNAQVYDLVNGFPDHHDQQIPADAAILWGEEHPSDYYDIHAGTIVRNLPNAILGEAYSPALPNALNQITAWREFRDDETFWEWIAEGTSAEADFWNLVRSLESDGDEAAAHERIPRVGTWCSSADALAVWGGSVLQSGASVLERIEGLAPIRESRLFVGQTGGGFAAGMLSLHNDNSIRWGYYSWE